MEVGVLKSWGLEVLSMGEPADSLLHHGGRACSLHAA